MSGLPTDSGVGRRDQEDVRRLAKFFGGDSTLTGFLIIVIPFLVMAGARYFVGQPSH